MVVGLVSGSAVFAQQTRRVAIVEPVGGAFGTVSSIVFGYVSQLDYGMALVQQQWCSGEPNTEGVIE